MVVVALLAAIVVVALGSAGRRSRSAAYGADAETLRRAEETHLGLAGRYGTEAELVDKGLLSTESTLHEVEVEDPPTRYRITCRLAPGCGAGGAIVRGGTLDVAVADVGAGGGILNPAVTTDAAVHANAEPMFSGLVKVAADGTPTPELAESWEISDDLRTATFTLRPGALWHDGSPVTAADVEFSFEAALLRYHSRTAGSMGPALGVMPNANPDLTVVPAQAITLPDGEGGRKVRFNFAYPYPPLLRQLTVTEAAVIPRAVYQACAAAGTLDDTETDPEATPPTEVCPQNLSPVGSGPFRFESVDRIAGVLSLRANPGYFRRGLPFLDALALRSLPDDLLTAALTAPRPEPGSVDWVFGVPAADIDDGARLSANRDVTLATSSRGPGGTNCAVSLAFNLWAPGTTPGAIAAKPAGAAYDHPVLAQPSVRRAIAQAFDRSASHAAIEFGQGRVSASPYHHALVPAHAPQPLPGFDPGGARYLLQSTGWLDPSGGADPTAVRVSDGRPGLPTAGTRLTLDNRHLATGAQVEYAAQLVENLRQVGIEVSPAPDPEPSDAVFARRDFDTAWVAYCHGTDPALGVRRQYHSDSISASPFSNAAGYRTPAMDILWDQVVLAPLGSEPYVSLHGRIQQKAVEDLPYVWVVDVLNVIGHRSECRGFDPDSTGTFAEQAWCSADDE